MSSLWHTQGRGREGAEDGSKREDMQSGTNEVYSIDVAISPQFVFMGFK